MDGERLLLSNLINGKRRQSTIDMPKSTRFKVARNLEDRGLMARDDEGWQLTRTGIMYALGIGVQPIPYELPPTDDEPEYNFEMAATLEYRRPSRIAQWLCVAVVVGIISLCLQQVSGYAQIW